MKDNGLGIDPGFTSISLLFSNDYMVGNTLAQASVWQLATGLWSAMAAGSGWNRKSERGRRSSSACRYRLEDVD